MFLKRKKRERMNVRESSVIRSPGHLSWTRGHCCAIEGKPNHTCHGKIEAHHVREGSSGGMGMKCDDSDAVPLCALAHRTGHDIGWATFQQRYGVNLPGIAADLWKRSPHRFKYERKRETA